MKKISALILSVLLTFSAAAVTAGAAEPNRSVPVTDGNVYKNLYTVTSDTAVEDNAAIPAEFDKLSDVVDSQSTAYLAFAVYTPKAGAYSFKLSFTGAEYAAVKAGGKVVRAKPDTAFTLELSKGLNLITCFGATADQNGAKITYSALLCENGLNPTEGEFYISGDANGDNSVNIIDLVRYKKYFAKTVEVKAAAADLNNDGTVDTGDMAILRKYLLGADDAYGTASLGYEIGYVMRDNDISDNWNY